MTIVDIGAVANDGTGDPLRIAFGKINVALAGLEASLVGEIGDRIEGDIEFAEELAAQLLAEAQQRAAEVLALSNALASEVQVRADEAAAAATERLALAQQIADEVQTRVAEADAAASDRAALAQLIADETQTRADETAARVEELRLTAETIRADRERVRQIVSEILEFSSRDFLEREELRRSLKVGIGEVTASFDEQITVLVSDTAALAAQITTLQTTTSTLAASVTQANQARIDGDETLAALFTSIVSGTATQFDSAVIWYFETDLETWTGSPSNPTFTSGGWLKPADASSVVSPAGLAVVSARYQQVRGRIRRIGTPTWKGDLWWAGSGESFDAGRKQSIAEPTFTSENFADVTWNLNWSGTIDRIQIELAAGADSSNYYEIDWIAIGRPTPGASSAELLELKQTVTDADSALASDLSALETRMNSAEGNVTANALAIDSTTTRVATLEGSVTSQSQSITDLEASVNDPTTGLDAVGQALDTLTAQVDVLNEGAGTTVFNEAIRDLRATVRGVALETMEGAARGEESLRQTREYSTEATQRLTTKIELTDAQVAINAEAITVLSSRITDAEGNVVANADAIQTLTTTVTQQGDAIDANSSAITSLNSSLGTKADAAALTALTTRVTDAEGVISANSAAITSLTSAVDGKASATALSAIDTRVTAAEGAISSNSSAITSLQNAVNDPTTGLSATSGALSNLTSRVTTAEGAISSQGSAITALQNTVNHPTTGVVATSGAVSSLTSRVTAAEGAISSNSSAITTLQNTVNHPTTGVAATSSALSALTSRVTTAEGTISSQGSAITSLQNAIDDPENGLSALGSAIDSLAVEVGLSSDGSQRVFSEALRDLRATLRYVALEGLEGAARGEDALRLAREITAEATQRLTTNVEANDALIRAASEAITALASRLSDAEGNLIANAGAIQTLNTEVSDQGGEIDANTAAITSLNTSIANKADASALSALTTRVTAAEGAITSQGNAITTLQNTVNDPTTGVAATSTALNALTTRVSTAEGVISSNSSAITALQNTVNNQTTGVVATSVALSSLASRVSTAEGAISSNSSAITALQNTVNHPTTGVAATSSALSTLTSRVSTAEGAISSNSSAITTLQNTVNHPTTGVAATSSALSTLTSRVSTAEGAISSNSSAITTLQNTVNHPTTGVAATSSALSTLTSRVTSAEGSLTALSAATTLVEARLQGANLISNSEFANGDLTGWTSVASTMNVQPRNVGSSVGSLVNAPRPYVLRVQQSSSTQSAYMGRNVPVNAGEILRGSFHFSVSGSPRSATFTVEAIWLDTSGVQVGSTSTIATGTTTSVPWARVVGPGVVVPDGAVAADFRFKRSAGGSGTAWATDIRIDRDGAGVDAITASGLFKMEAVAGPNGYSSIALMSRTSTGNEFRQSGFQIDNPTNQSLPSRVSILADQFVFRTATGVVRVPFYFDGNNLYLAGSAIKLTGDTEVDGTFAIRSGTSGERVETKATGITVYDASNVARVKIGLL